MVSGVNGCVQIQAPGPPKAERVGLRHSTALEAVQIQTPPTSSRSTKPLNLNTANKWEFLVVGVV